MRIYHRLFCVDRICFGNLEVKPESLTRSLPLVDASDIHIISDRRERNRRLIELEAVQLDRVAEARLFDFDLVTHGARPAYGKGYAGRYGERTISSENDALYLQREGGPKL